MLLLPPIAAFVLFYLILRETGTDWRSSVLGAAVFWGACLTGITEALSVPHYLTRGGVAVSWLAVCFTAAIILANLKRRVRYASIEVSADPAKAGLDAVTWALLAGAGLIVLLVGVTALVAPPNIWDAMEYHLPRVTMWMSNRSVGFYPTPDYAQLVWGPWAEYAMTHTYLLWGSDRLVNLVEFFSLLGSMIGVSLIAKRLGAGPRGQALAAIVCATIPEGVLEASGPMNTYVVSFWIMTTIVFVMRWNDDPNWLNTACIGLSAGLAVLTKGTAYIFLPCLVFAAWWMGSSSSRVLLVKRSVVLIALILAINGAQYLRCYELSGSPLGVPLPDAGSRLQVAMPHPSVRATVANAFRNLSLHFGAPSDEINAWTERMFRFAIQSIGVNPDDPEQVWLGEHFQINHFSSDEGIAGNPLHLALLLLSIGVVFWQGKTVLGGAARWYAAGIVLAYLVFCALLLWQRWASRYEMPLFVLGSALTGLVLERYCSRKLAATAAVAMLALACLFAVANKTRALVRWSRVDDVYQPRAVQYFAHLHQQVAPEFIAAAEAVNQLQCREVAVDAYQDQVQGGHSPRSFYIYPLFPLIHADGRDLMVWYSGVHNGTQRYAAAESHPAPCAVVCLDCANMPQKWAEYRQVGGRASVFDYIVVFSSVGEMANSGLGVRTP
jgi:hypothetical protein